jgi:3-dehydroquinate synthetase
MVETYNQNRLNEANYKGTLTKPATVNRGLACLKTICSQGVRNGKAEYNPTNKVKLLEENNVRKRVLTLGSREIDNDIH